MDTEFAKRLAMVRQEKGLTQQRLADRLGVTAQAVSKYETGASLPEIDTLKAIAMVLGCSTDYLLGHELTQDSQINMLDRERRDEIDRALHKECLGIDVGVGLVDLLMEENKNHYERFHKLRVKLASEYGILVPIVRLKDNVALENKEYQILLHGKTVIGQGKLEYPMFFYPQKKAEDKTQIEGREPVWNVEGVWRKQEEEGKISCMDIIIVHLEKLILENYDKILNRQIVADMVSRARSWCPAAVDGVVPEKVSFARLQNVITRLVKEKLPVNRMDYLIGFLEEHPELNSAEYEQLKAGL